MSDLYLEIVSPSKTVFKGEVNSITVPGTLGKFQILKNHAPIVSTLEIGELRIRNKSEIRFFAISGGTIEVLNNKVLILADSIEDVDEIDLERAKRSKERAEKRLQLKDKDLDVPRAQASLARALNRIRLKESHSSKRI